VEEILLFNNFFLIVDTCLSCENMARQSCAMVHKDGDFLRPVFAPSRVQHISDLQSKFAVRPHHVWKYGRHPVCDSWEQARKKRKKEEATAAAKYDVHICYAGQS